MSRALRGLIRPVLVYAPPTTRTVIAFLAQSTPASTDSLVMSDEQVMQATGVSEPSVRRARRWGRSAGLFEATSGVGHASTIYLWQL